MDEERYYIRKTIAAGVYYLSPKMSRWIPENSTKYRFGTFLLQDATAFIEVKQIDNPETKYELTSTELKTK